MTRVAGFAAAAITAGCLLLGVSVSAEPAEPTAAPTFSRDVAPILFSRCGACHHPGGVAPFSLLDYRGAAIRAAQIAEVTASRYMPPWLPAPGDYAFVGERRLSDEEITTLARWAAAGALEGDPADLPPVPHFDSGWQLGEPDLVVTLSEPFPLPAEAPADVFRNFVLPLPVAERRWVRAFDLLPDPPRVIHHAVAQIDDTPISRRADEADPGLGFGGMGMGGSQIPDGQILAWTPGNFPDAGNAGVAWRLDPGMDLVLQLHMPPSGKPESVRPRVGLYFADAPPTETAFTLMLGSSDIDIPPGERDYRIRANARLPVAVGISSLYPHAHYLGREMLVWAVLPDGERRTLLHIPRWNFSWQDEYRFAEPVQLPAGTEIAMEFAYDNSSANPRNPHRPPQRVQWGDESDDEMGNLAVQVLLDRPEDLAAVARVEAEERLERNPRDWAAHQGMGSLLLDAGDVEGAIAHLEQAAAHRPDQPALLADLGRALSLRGDLEAAIEHYRSALALAPDEPALLLPLGEAILAAGRPDEAVEILRMASTRAPERPRVHYAHARAAQAAGHWQESADAWAEALRVGGDNPEARYNLGVARVLGGQVEAALPDLRAALAAQPTLASSLASLVEFLDHHPDPAMRRPEAAALLRPLLE